MPSTVADPVSNSMLEKYDFKGDVKVGGGSNALIDLDSKQTDKF